jgi:hypothetical protein
MYRNFGDLTMSMSLTALRQQLFKVVDQVIATGIPMEIKRNGHIVKIVLADKKSKLENLVKHDCIVGDSEELVDLSLQEWNEESNL